MTLEVCEPIRQTLKEFYADALANDFSDLTPNRYFLAIGRALPWPDDTRPPLATDSRSEFLAVWRDLIVAKRLDATNVRYVVPRIDWEYSTAYDAYRDDADLSASRFYVLYGDRVYKCIDNAGGAPSTYPPIGTSVAVTDPAPDGYRWKFMFQLSESDREFLSSDWIPVKRFVRPGESTVAQLQIAVQSSAVDGSIDHVELLDAGDEFIYARTADPTNVVDAVRGAAEYVLNGQSVSLVESAYVGYTMRISGVADPLRVNIIGQQREIVAYGGDSPGTRTVRLASDFSPPASPGDQYEILPRAVVNGDGSGCEIQVKVNPVTRRVQRLAIDRGGSGYTTAGVDVLPSRQGAARPTARVVISPRGGHGSDPTDELQSRAIMVLADIDRDEGGTVPDVNEIRRIAIIRNPILSSTGEVAGTETPPLVVLRVTATSPIPSTTFASIADRLDYVYGLSSGAMGQVAAVPADNHTGLTIDTGSLNRGRVFVRGVVGKFIPGERLIRVVNTGGTFLSFDYVEDSSGGPIVVSSIESLQTNDKTVYTGYTTIYLASVSAGLTLGMDDLLSSATGSARIIDFRDEPGNVNGTAYSSIARVSMVSGVFLPSQILSHTRSDSPITTNPAATIAAGDRAVAMPELARYTGELVIAENLRPIVRSGEQREEIRIVFGT